MNKQRVAVILGIIMVLALTASAFAELVVTYSSSDDTWSEYTVQDTAERDLQATTDRLIRGHSGETQPPAGPQADCMRSTSRSPLTLKVLIMQWVGLSSTPGPRKGDIMPVPISNSPAFPLLAFIT